MSEWYDNQKKSTSDWRKKIATNEAQATVFGLECELGRS
jgi:hypothetical protein